jgi:poly(3-hydroxybutyrate) depolymerase
MSRLAAWIFAVTLLAGCGGGTGAVAAGPVPTVQETQCTDRGWQRLVIDAAGLQRVVLWKAPAGGWARGALVVMHGGGGQHANFCVANVAQIQPQVRLTELALAQGFAVFLPDSSDRITDTQGRLCGKVWDDEVRNRANLDLPFLEGLLATEIPRLRPTGSRTEVFLAGHSSGGYMTVRAATALAAHVTAFAPVSSGDPYGWFRDCTPRPGDRVNVFGAGFDNETLRQIIEPGACSAPAYPNEKPWDGAATAARPGWRAFHHTGDGINDVSCVEKLRRQLADRGYPEAPPFTLQGDARTAQAHQWLDEYNQPLLDFFASRLR